jgi:hypothetical protein
MTFGLSFYRAYPQILGEIRERYPYFCLTSAGSIVKCNTWEAILKELF